ncbi:hypothetical protein [Gemmatimonas sp.]|uniref:hypothetical protein n=1 Tax=Gemmatimonas sp. TaxID=1962908 RepID=UPI00286BA2F2|nr:hypothetical protein [Gemmatimonas sp.]
MADIPRTALERVLARASELQTTTSEGVESVSEERLLDIAKEVGLDLAHVRQAIAEERARLPMSETESGPLLNSLGPASLGAQRTVPGTPDDILRRLDSWMPRMESLSTRRRIGDRQSWEPRRDPFGNFLRSFGVGGRRFDLVRVDQVTASVTAIDGVRSVVRLDADIAGMRRMQRNQAVALVIALGMLYALIAVPVLFLVSTGAGVGILAGLTAFVGGGGFLGWRALRRAYRNAVDRMHLRIEQLLDELEQDRMKEPPNLLQKVVTQITAR